MTFLADRVTNVPVSFRQLRMKDAEGALQEGVVGANDLKIVQRAAGANQSVDFSVGAGYINIDSGTRSGLSHFYNDAVANVAVPASNATNPRIDQAIVRYNDSSIPAGTGGNTPTPEILPGTATAGATLDNRTGAAALPNDCLRLADILVPAASTSVVTANIRDRRAWARGAYNRIIRNSGANLTTASATLADLDATNLKPRIECSGAPLRLSLMGTSSHSVSNGLDILAFAQDGTLIDGTGVNEWQQQESTAAGGFTYKLVRWDTVPAAGSHLFSPQFAVSTAGTMSVTQSATAPLIFVVEELVVPNANNS